MEDNLKLPSGAIVDLSDVDFSQCKSSDDCWEILQGLEEKIISIEFQLECVGLGRHPNGSPLTSENPPPDLWEPRANQALKWCKLRKADAQRELGKFGKREKQDQEQQ